MTEIDVSVVVTTKNEELNIENCLQSIKKQNYPKDKIEIIVVDNYSDDRTNEIASTFTEHIYCIGPERSAQRNFGIEKSSGKYFLFLDADMILSENVVSECYEKCGNEGHIALYVPEKIVGEGFWIKVRNFEREFYNATCVDAVRFIRKKIFLETGGFDLPLIAAEDWDLNRRLEKFGSSSIINSPLFHNEGKFSLKKYLNKKYFYSVDISKYIRKWGRNDPIIKKQLGLWYRFFGVFIENGKWKRLLSHPVLACGMYFLRFMVGVQFLKKRFSSQNG